MHKSWEKFLNPITLKKNLIKASIYIVFFEQLQNVIIEKIRDFYTLGFENGKDIIDDKYKSRFYKDGVKILNESLHWLIEHEVITINEKEEIIKLKDHRDQLAHELLNFVTSTEKDVKDELLISCYNILTKIETWWIKEVEIPIDINLKHENIDYDNIESMRMIILQLLSIVYFNKDKELEEIYNILKDIKS